ncbi:MAG: flagellar motor protein MotB [Desulfovibrionaceae bacterium]|nr:flagellar motor protein MotB [Desulfovibrionaceae bacterium]
MAEEQEHQVATGAESQEKRVTVRQANRRLPSSYANVFQTRVVDNMVCISYGLSYPENNEGETNLTVDLERRIIMLPEAAARLAQTLNRLLSPTEEAPKA